MTKKKNTKSKKKVTKYELDDLMRPDYIIPAIIVIALLWAAVKYIRSLSDNDLSVGSEACIKVTPERVSEIMKVGQWEFMSVYDEVVVDTVRSGKLFGDDRLVCIYYGTLRLGIDLKDAREDWVRNVNDSVTVTLPAPKLLDDNFIDEARTDVFYEKGKWDGNAKEQMYDNAARKMKKTALTRSNLETVRRKAKNRVESLFYALGAKNVEVVIE